MKRLLVLLMVLMCVALCAGAEDADYDTLYSYEVVNDTVTITKYIGQETDVVVPAVIGGFPVTAIGVGAFDCDMGWTIRSIQLPEGITAIDDEAFLNCGNLKELELPQSLVTLGSKAFQYSGITSIHIPANVTNIGAGVFASAENLESVTIDPQNAAFEMIGGVLYDVAGKRAVSSVTQLIGTSHVVPEGNVAIDDYAFYDCYSLASVTLPEGLKTIGDFAFAANNAELKALHIPDSVTAIGSTAFFGSGLEHIALPKSLKTLGDRAFTHCYSLQSVEISAGITEIKENTFAYCSGLKTATIPSSVKVIGEGAFTDCALETITLPYGVERIGDWAFAGCKKLKEIAIPGTVSSIGGDSFASCNQDMKVIVEEGSEAEKFFAQNGADIEYGEFAPPVLPGDSTGDGNVDIFDALAILQFAVGWDVELNEEAGDVNDDGKCDIFDALLILQYSVGWDVELK